jgi:methionyl-tRNA formyltransferase
MKVLLASSSLLAVPALDLLLQSDYELLGVMTMPDAPQGRGREVRENEFALKARTFGLPVFKPRNSDELLEVLTKTNADLVITIAYGRLIRLRELSTPQYGWLNIHFSLLPRWRGAAPAQRAIEAGDRKSGVTVFKLDEGLDTGPIYATAEYELRELEDSLSLLRELSSLSVSPLRKALAMIKEGTDPVAQSNDEISTAAKLTKAEGRIDWKEENLVIERKIRAFNPWPSAWTYFKEQRISITKATLSHVHLPPGHLSSGERLIVGCGKGSLEILSLKSEGKREMSATEWMRGARLTTDARFE